MDKSQKAKFTAKILNRFLDKAHQILKEHPLNKKRKKMGLLPANYILVRGAGKIKKVISFQKKWGLKPCCIAGGALYKGIAKFLGFDLIKVTGANALPTTNLKGKIEAVKKALRKHDFVFCHIKAADNLAEDGNFFGKKEFIEKIDKNLKKILNLENSLIVVTGDHSTCSDLKRHCSEPVPVLIFGSEKDHQIEEFSEKYCKKGWLGEIPQLELMPKILKYTQNYAKNL